jgi:hypothetical protein
MKTIARVAVVVTLAILAAPDDAWAGRGRGSGHRSGARSAPVHHHHPHFHGSFFLGTPFWVPRPYYAYPALPYLVSPPTYVERYGGEPTPDTRDVIFCPNRNAYYPDATDCPGGWARVIPPG